MVEPYYDHAGITIYHGDCREILPGLEPVDLVLTDPPYGISADKNAYKNGVKCRANGFKAHTDTDWDSSAIDTELLLSTISIAKEAIVWGGNYFNLPSMAGWLVWDKVQRKFSFADGELAWTNIGAALRIFSYARGNESGFAPKLKPADKVFINVHPTQKPMALIMWCIKLADNPQTILDPFMGSGTTLRAAKDLGRKAIGIEIEEKYCEIAAKRLSQEVLPL